MINMSFLWLFLFSLLNNLYMTSQQAIAGGILQQNVYQFIKSNQLTSRFGQLLDTVAQQTNDRSVIKALSGDNSPGSGGIISNTGYTVFVPINNAFNTLPTDPNVLKNDIYNLVVKDKYNLDRFRQLNGTNIMLTFGFMPRLVLRTVKNTYLSQSSSLVSVSSTGFATRNRQIRRRKRRQSMYTTRSSYSGQPMYPRQTTSYNQLNYQNTEYPGQLTTSFNQIQSSMYPGQAISNNNFQNQWRDEYNNQSDLSIHEIYTQMYGSKAGQYSGPPISTKLPLDELYLLNSAIILDRFELMNGIVYTLSAYPRYYEKSLLGLLTDGNVNGLAPNLNFWISKAAQSFRLGDENLKNALNAYGPNTYFLPTDQAINKFTNRDQLNNATFLFDVLFKSHRVSNQLLFDLYLDDSSINYYTDTGLPVSTVHRYINGIEEIEVSIGHVKGRILPGFRNIYCASGVIHLIDTVLGVPSKSAYQEISSISELSTFRSILDRSPTYRQMLDQAPSPNFYSSNSYFSPRVIREDGNKSARTNESSSQLPRPKRQYTSTPSANFYNNNNQFYTILAPNDFALAGIKDSILNNQSSIDQFIMSHIIPNQILYTDHDDNIFRNGQAYPTLNSNFVLSAMVQQSPTSITNQVTLQVQGNQAIYTDIVNGNDRVSNGVVHIVDRALVQPGVIDIAAILSANNPGSPAFSQFVDALRSTGIFNDLRQPAKKYTLFIPTNEALAQYQDIINSNDIERKRNLIYRHICLDQNLQSTYLTSQNGQPSYMTSTSSFIAPNPYQSNQLICRNALGQDVSLSKDSSGLISNWQGMAQSKVINDFSGIYSSAYVLENTLLNQNLPNYGLNNVNNAIKIKNNFNLIFFYLICILLLTFFD